LFHPDDTPAHVHSKLEALVQELREKNEGEHLKQQKRKAIYGTPPVFHTQPRQVSPVKLTTTVVENVDFVDTSKEPYETILRNEKTNLFRKHHRILKKFNTTIIHNIPLVPIIREIDRHMTKWGNAFLAFTQKAFDGRINRIIQDVMNRIDPPTEKQGKYAPHDRVLVSSKEALILKHADVFTKFNSSGIKEAYANVKDLQLNPDQKASVIKDLDRYLTENKKFVLTYTQDMFNVMIKQVIDNAVKKHCGEPSPNRKTM
jgi:hypothetical protein